MQNPKVVVIGAGSLFFGREAIWQMVHSPHLNCGTLALVDTDGERLKKMSELAAKVIASEGVSLKLEASTDRADVLAEADFVVLSFADRGVHFRGVDCDVSAKYGIRMCSGDTIGPGGIFRTLRELPVIMKVCKDVERLCPDAWVINYINPTTANGIGLMRYAPGLKSFALCDGLHMPHIKRKYALRAGIIDSFEDYTDQIAERFDLQMSGPNHFTWILKAEFDGQDVVPQIVETIRRNAAAESDSAEGGAKSRFNEAIGYALYDVYGYIPTRVAHTKEYVRFWQGLGKTPEAIPPLEIWQTAPRYKRHEEMWKQVDDFLSAETPIGEYMTSFGPDHATDIIESMWAGLGKQFYVNTPNDGAVSNMPNDAYLENLCDIDMGGPRPVSIGDAPLGLKGLWHQVLDAHELTAEAAVTCDRNILRRAMLTDPMVNSIADADAIIEELLQAERDALPAGWFE